MDVFIELMSSKRGRLRNDSKNNCIYYEIFMENNYKINDCGGKYGRNVYRQVSE